MNVEKVGAVSARKADFSFKSSNNEKQNSGIKEHLNLRNTVLGTLATLGVLGMADILIFKGKHISKLTGKNKYIPEFFDYKKFDRAAYDAKLDRTIPKLVKDTLNIHETKSVTHYGNRVFFFEKGKLAKIVHYDPKTNVSKIERIATENQYELLHLENDTIKRGKEYKIGDVCAEEYFLGNLYPEAFFKPTSMSNRGCKCISTYLDPITPEQIESYERILKECLDRANKK